MSEVITQCYYLDPFLILLIGIGLGAMIAGAYFIWKYNFCKGVFMATLNSDQVHLIKMIRKRGRERSWDSYGRIAKEFNISVATLKNCLDVITMQEQEMFSTHREFKAEKRKSESILKCDHDLAIPPVWHP
jgi:hypothetical protein